MSKVRQPIRIERNPIGTDARPGVTITMPHKTALLDHYEAADLEKALRDVRLAKRVAVEVSI